MDVGSESTRLIVLRGNSGSGKSTAAQAIREAYGRGLAWVCQDIIRRTILREHDYPGMANIGLIEQTARYALDHGYHVVLEGILYADRYESMLARLHRDHRGPTYFYYFDVSLAETVRRHATRPQATAFTPADMESWYRQQDCLTLVTERLIDESSSLDDTVDRILSDTGLLDSPHITEIQMEKVERAPTRHERLTRVPWDHSYQDASPPWDSGRPQSAFLQLAEHAGAVHGRVLDAGCGTGENALAFAAAGFEAWGVDVASTAIEIACRKASERNLTVTFKVEDALQLQRLQQRFDTVLDSGLFHTFDDEERARYVDSLGTVIEPNGTVHLLCFSDAVAGDGGPRRISRAEICSAFADGWHVVDIRATRYETRFGGDGSPAWLATIRRADTLSPPRA
ncbi:methyltransferase domain-containing protein [Actinopolymorpha sp. B17G11]|uniref:methyltransferase domain-containing protein n=1 Tax=Actinopolymorpha sp. B17G11 TaxID=3160861 RepID=UPI0032E3D0C0